jgi:hypothetical protein
MGRELRRTRAILVVGGWSAAFGCNWLWKTPGAGMHSEDAVGVDGASNFWETSD